MHDKQKYEKKRRPGNKVETLRKNEKRRIL
jgi:hypothetical protein